MAGLKIQYPARIINGVLKVTRRKDFDKEIACQKDMYCFITIEKASKKRSNPQNRYYWGVVVPLVRKGFLENGWESYELSYDQVHDCIKHKFCRTELVNEDTGEMIETVKGTSQMTTTEFMDFVATVQQWSATFFNIEIPDPNQEWFIDRPALFTSRKDLYDSEKPELKERTKNRLKQIEECGMTEVGIAQFGYEGVMSGLYIEFVWSYSDEKFNDYMDWAKGLINEKQNSRTQT